MSPIIFWMLGISFSAAMTIMAAALDYRGLQFGLSIVMAGFIALAAYRDQRALAAIGAFPTHLTATVVRHMGLLYGWAAVMIALVYGLLLDWSGWFIAFCIMTLGATLCLFLANILMRDLTEHTIDKHIVTLVGSIAKAQFAATCISFGGLLALGYGTSSRLGGETSWVAVNLLMAAALGLAAHSAYVIAFPMGLDAETDDDAPSTYSGPERRAPSAEGTGTSDKPDRRRKTTAKTFGKARATA